MIGVVRRYPLASFFTLAYALAWADWIPIIARGEVVRPGALPTHFPGLLGPAVAAVIVTALLDGWRGVCDLLAGLVRCKSAGWFAFAMLSPFVLWAVAVAALALAGERLPDAADFGVYPGLPAASGFVVFAAVMVVDGGGEETGWRGFALSRLRARHSTLVATLILAVLWAGWHLPMFWMNATMMGMSAPMVIGFVFGLACGAMVLTWIYVRAGDSILAAALWHTGYNMVSGSAAGASTAAVVTTAIVLGAIVLVIGDVRARRRALLSPLDARS